MSARALILQILITIVRLALSPIVVIVEQKKSEIISFFIFGALAAGCLLIKLPAWISVIILPLIAIEIAEIKSKPAAEQAAYWAWRGILWALMVWLIIDAIV